MKDTIYKKTESIQKETSNDMFNMLKHSLNSTNKIKLIIYSISMIAIIVIISVINANASLINVWGIPLSKVPVSGVSSVIIIMLCLLTINVDNRIGYILSLITLFLELYLISVSVFKRHNYQSFAGIAMMIGGIIMCTIHHNYLKKIESNQEHLIKLSFFDELTGLANRRLLIDIANEKIAENIPFTLFSLNLNNFKTINDLIGHFGGDAVLCEVADRWSHVIDENCILARTGGDDFMMLVYNLSFNESVNIVQKCIDTLDDVIKIDDLEYIATINVGSASFPKDANDCSTLMGYADTSMCKSKELGKNLIYSFDSIMMDKIRSDMNVESEIRNAIENDTFRLFFQPQYTANTKKLRGYESLIRMNGTDGKPISPGIFIPVAEKSGLILDIDLWVLRKAMTTFIDKVKEEDITVSVNISAMHITHPGFADEVASILEETGFPPRHLEIEVTESSFISSIKDAITTLNQLKEKGVLIALDDFGTGYASLSYLSNLPIDLLKIDKSFVDKLNTDNKQDDFVKCIVDIGHNLKCDVIAEGVEEDKQLNTLRNLGCDFIQGYIWGKPLPYEELYGK